MHACPAGWLFLGWPQPAAVRIVVLAGGCAGEPATCSRSSSAASGCSLCRLGRLRSLQPQSKLVCGIPLWYSLVVFRPIVWQSMARIFTRVAPLRCYRNGLLHPGAKPAPERVRRPADPPHGWADGRVLPQPEPAAAARTAADPDARTARKGNQKEQWNRKETALKADPAELAAGETVIRLLHHPSTLTEQWEPAIAWP